MDDNWKEIKVEGIANIERCVAEFNVWELNKNPWGKFKVKVFERSDKKGIKYTGYTNLLIKDSSGSAECGVGYGDTLKKHLKIPLNTLFPY